MALPCETYLDSNSIPYTSIPDCCYWDDPCEGCPWLLSGLPTITTQCMTRQFNPTSSMSGATCPLCATGYTTTATSKICCWTSDAFDSSTFCSTVSPCVCSATQSHAIFNPMLNPPQSSVSPLQCISDCKTNFAGGPYYQLAGDTCVTSNAFAQACPVATVNTLGVSGTQRTLIRDGVCDVALNLVSVSGSTAIASDLLTNPDQEMQANKAYRLASYLVWVGIFLTLLGFWGNRAYLRSNIPSVI